MSTNRVRADRPRVTRRTRRDRVDAYDLRQQLADALNGVVIVRGGAL